MATTIRHVTGLAWHREPDGILVATVAADAFCQAMVRSLVGALLAVGDKHWRTLLPPADAFRDHLAQLIREGRRRGECE